MINDGAICLHRCLWKLAVDLKGSDCISISGSSELEISNSLFWEEHQIIYFGQDHTLSKLFIDIAEQPNIMKIQIVGFGKGHLINFARPMKSWTYENGILSLGTKRKEYSIFFYIGDGYHKKRFNLRGTKMTYSAVQSVARPKICACSGNDVNGSHGRFLESSSLEFSVLGQSSPKLSILEQSTLEQSSLNVSV